MTVSGSDFLNTVSAGDAYVSVSSGDLSEDSALMECLNGIQSNLSMICFFLLFAWMEMRIRNAIGRWLGNGKLD